MELYVERSTIKEIIFETKVCLADRNFEKRYEMVLTVY